MYCFLNIENYPNFKTPPAYVKVGPENLYVYVMSVGRMFSPVAIDYVTFELHGRECHL